MTLTSETSLFEYHRKEWDDFVNYLIESGDIDEDTDSEYLATQYWDEFENECGTDSDPVWTNIHYSAGVYIGEIDSNNITNRVIINDVKWYDDNGEEFTPQVDMVEVTLMNTNPDLYADTCEAAIGVELSKLITSGQYNALYEVADLTGKDVEELVSNVITSNLNRNYPELLEVLAEWNQNHSVDEVIDFFCESNKNTITSILENEYE